VAGNTMEAGQSKRDGFCMVGDSLNWSTFRPSFTPRLFSTKTLLKIKSAL